MLDGGFQLKFKAVIFDMDGVIFDSERLYIECNKEVAHMTPHALITWMIIH